MERRVFICVDSQFPYGTAGSNYVRYLALALLESDWKVIVIGMGNDREEDYYQQKQSYYFKGIEYSNIFEKKSPKHMLQHLFYSKYITEKLNSYSITENDYFILYSGNGYSSMIEGIRRNYQYIPDNHFSICAVEWFQPFQFKYGRLDPKYLLWNYTFLKVMPKIKKIIPISRNLERHFFQYGCETFLMPMMSDSESGMLPSRNNSDIRQFIYPGNGIKKDSFLSMFQALRSLSEDDLNQIRFHITGTSKQNIKRDLGRNGYLLNELKDVLIFHDWLEYDELLSLYKKMDFLLLAREKNIVTISNFPSKVSELMNYGIIPVCSDVGDYTELYLTDGEDSIIFEGDSKQACKQAIRDAISLTPEKLQSMKENARKCVEENFDYRIWSKKINDFILS